MFFLIIKKEIVHNILSFRFVVTYALLFCLILLAMFLMTNDYSRRVQEYNRALGQEREWVEKIQNLEDANEQFRQVQQASFVGSRRPKNLSILARGLEGNLPTQVNSGRWGWFIRTSEDHLGKNMLFEIFQAPDFVYVINIVMSLLALLFVFDSVCGEKEQGTLKLLLANSVPRDLVLIGKWIGGYLSVIAPFSVAVLGGFAYIYISGNLDAGNDNITRFFLIYCISLLYISAFFTLGLMISTLTHHTSTALLVALLVWICWILVVPNLSPIVARLVAPVPSRQVIDGEKQAIDREAQLLLEGIRKRKVYGDQAETERIQGDADKRKNKLEEFYQDRMRTQVVLSQNLARVSPSASFLFAATRLASTGPSLYRFFQQAQEKFSAAAQEFQRGMFDNNLVEWSRQGPQVKDPNWFNADNLPRFKIFEERLGDSFNEVLFDILLLAIYNVLFFMLSYTFFLRYDVT